MREVSCMPQAYREEAAELRDRILHARRERILEARGPLAAGPAGPPAP